MQYTATKIATKLQGAQVSGTYTDLVSHIDHTGSCEDMSNLGYR